MLVALVGATVIRATSMQMANDDQQATKTITTAPNKDAWRRRCGCIKTSEKLKQIIMTFPTAPPPTPPATPQKIATPKPLVPEVHCISACCHGHGHDFVPVANCNARNTLRESLDDSSKSSDKDESPPPERECVDSWQMVAGLVSLLQLSVTATALAVYYLIYCYMQLVYYTLKSALYFHHADGPMKITIGVMTLTSIVIGFNILLRMERLMGMGF